MKETLGKKLYSFREYYKIYYLALFSSADFRKAKKNKLMDEHFIERIMISVTEVNGCSLCSYAHAKMALESGMSNEEIQNMLAGVSDDVPKDEIAAVMFAQHYAEYRGKPSKKSWEQLLEVYGPKKSRGILAATRIIMFGNTSGIALGSFTDRFKKNKTADKRLNVFYEIGILLLTVIYFPVALVHTFLARLFRVSTINFKDN